MVKYGKEFRKNQKADWKDKYFDYKSKKQKIKSLMKEKEDSGDSEIILLQNLEKWSGEFKKNLDKDIKKVYIFFAGKERILYKQINESLHLKKDDEIFNLKGYTDVFKHLKEISDLSLNMSYFIFYNLKAVIKILKKFDKKIITPKYKDYQIRFNYIQTKIEEQNSDILYLIKFKMIDEVNLLLENLINKLMKEFKSNKDSLEDENEEQTIGEIKLIEDIPEMNDSSRIIKEAYSQIKNNIQEIDKVSALVQKLFMPWKDFLKISTDINSKFLQITRQSTAGFKEVERTQSLSQIIGFSKDSKLNIYIVLAHGFLYMFSFSVIIPTSTLIVYSFELEKSMARIYWAILMMMAPLGTLFNYLYETFLFKKSTKKPLVLSCIGLIIGNILYMISPGLNVISLLFVGRFICGLFNLRTHNKMYIINFLTKKDISFYLTMFHTTSTLGLAVGFLVNAGLINIESKNEYINRTTIGALITTILSFVLLIISIVLFTEAHSNNFNITSMQMYGEGIISDESSNDNFDGELSGTIKKQTNALKDIDVQLGNFNLENSFDDTNLVSKNVNALALREEEKLHYLLSDFFVYLLIIFTTKFINESIYINSYVFLDDEETEEDQWLISIILGSSSLLTLLVELSLSRKYKFITERTLIIILLFLLLAINILFIILNTKIVSFYFLIALDTIMASITEKYTAHLFLYIMPENYVICKINGNVFISIFSMLSRIICCSLLFFSRFEEIYNYIILAIMTFLSFICFLLYIIFYKEIRIKAINRILSSNPSDEIKIATEV